jgi:hypothetical protein
MKQMTVITYVVLLARGVGSKTQHQGLIVYS